MIYRGYDIKTPFPPGSGNVTVEKDGNLVHEFPFTTTDETVMDWIDAHRRKELKK